MRTAILFLYLTPLLTAGPSRLYRWSLAALTTANVIDGVSSVGLRETNPILGRGSFGTRSIALKGAIIGGVVAFEYAVRRKAAFTAKPLAYTNFIMAGAVGGVAVRNFRMRGTR